MLAGATLWGTAGTALALGPAAAEPWQVATLRMLVGATLLLALAGATGGTGAPPRPRAAAGLAAVAMALFQVGYFAAIGRLGVALGTAVAIGSGPVFAGAVERLALGVAPERRWWPATALAVAGVVVLLADDDPAAAADLPGLGAGLLAGASFASFAVASRRVLTAGADPVATMGWLLGTTGALLVPVAVALTALTDAPWTWLGQAPGLAAIGWIAAIATAAAYALFGRGLAHVSAGSAATLTLAEPLTAAVLGVGLLAERLTALELVGGLAVLAGLVVLSVRR